MLDIVVASPYHLGAAIAATPIADHGTLIAPLIAQDSGEQVAVL